MRKMIIFNLIMAILIIAAYSVDNDQPVNAALSGHYYVSADGSDFNPGTEEKPWKTIQKAAESASPGSTVHIREGTYYERIDIKVSGESAEKPVVFRSHENDKVVIDGSQSSLEEQADLVHISNQSYVQIIGIEITNNIGGERDELIAGIGIWGQGDGIEIRDCRIHQIGYTGSDAGSGAFAVAVYGRDDEKPISGLVIDGNEIWDIKCGKGQAVALNGNIDGFRFTNNYVHDNDSTGLALLGDKNFKNEAVCSVESSNRARNGFVAYNKMERNSSAGNPVSSGNDYGAGGIIADGTKDVTIAYNICKGNDIGIAVVSETRDKVSRGITVRDNLIYENNNSGLLAGGRDVNKGWAVDCRFLNNTLYDNDIQRQGRGEINIAKSHDLFFHSNVIYTGSRNLAVSTEDFGERYIYNNTFHHNLYYGPGGSRGLRFTGVGTGLVGLNMWRQKTGQDVNSGIADPQFADAAQGDFRLFPNSPAIDSGDPAYIPAEDVTDFAGEPRVKGRTVDCGAYEF